MIRYVLIRDKVGVISIEDKMSEARPRWFVDIKRRVIDIPVRRCEKIVLPKCKKIDVKLRRVGTK